MTIEERLTQVLQAEVSQVDTATEWADVERGLAARRRTRRLRQAALSTVAAAALVAGVLAVVSENDRESGLRVVPPATQPTVGVATTLAPTTTMTTAAPTTAFPVSVIVQRGTGEVVELSSIDGHQLRMLLPSTLEPDSRIYSGTISTALGHVAYTERGGRIYRIDLETSEAEDIGAGASPAVSPDSNKLAFVTDSGRSVGADRLVVRDLVTGRERTWTAPPPGPNTMATAIHRLNWAADSRRLAIQEGWENDLDVAVLDTTEATLRPVRIAQGHSVYTDPVYYDGTDSLIVTSNDDDDYGEPTPNRIVTIDSETGQVTATLVDEVLGGAVASDVSGQHILYLRFHDQTYELWRLHAGKSVRIATDVVAADW